MISDINEPESSGADDRLSIIRRIQHNIGIVFGGNAAVSVLGVVTLSFNARALGVTGLGILALIMTVATLLNHIFAFQSWVPLVKLGSHALESGDRRRLGDLTMVALLFDTFAAAAASLSAVIVILLAGEKLGIPREYIGVAALYMVTLITRISDAPTGLLRLFNRFAIITAIQVTSAAFVCTLAVCLFFVGASLTAYIFGYAAINVATNLVLLACGLRVGLRAGIPFGVREIGPALRSTWREFWSFSWVMSISGTIYVVREHAPVLLVGQLLGPGAVGLLHVAMRIAGVLSMAMWAVNQALYPEIARLASNRRTTDLKWFVVRTGAYCCALGLAALLGAVAFGPLMLSIIGGPDYAGAYWPLNVLIAAHCFALAGVGLRAAIIVTAGPMKLLIANLVAFAGFVITAVPGIIQLGIVGAAATQVVFEALAIVVAISQYLKSSRQVSEVEP